MFWGTMPDRELFDAAASGELDAASGIEAQARRLLADPRSRFALDAFARQWLGIERLTTTRKRPELFPQFTDHLRASMIRETETFVSRVILEGGRLRDLFTAGYTFVDAELAALYDMQGGSSGFERADYPEGQRAGIFGHASILAATAHSDQTSPILRGLFVRERLLCQDLPPPPAFAGGVPEVDPNATTRDRFEQHTADPVCAGCHQYIDDVGFGFERFDAIGAYRETEQGLAIDARGDMNDVEGLGTGVPAPYASLPELAQIVADSRAAPDCFVRQYYRYARGFRESLADRCARQWLEERFAASGYDLRELMVDVAVSPDFVRRR
jgi:hypothetical protein